MSKQNVIIFSSFKSLPIVNALNNELKKNDSICSVCWDEYFENVYSHWIKEKKTYPLFRFLTKRVPSFDFAIVIAGRDDTVLKGIAEDEKDALKSNAFEKAEQVYLGMRDNVIFELGMCCMALGESRVILLRQDGVRLFADLRGNNASLLKAFDPEKKEYHSTPLTVDNIQLKAFDFKYDSETNNNIADISPLVIKYIEEMADDYAPVVVGASCSTAQGYMKNFIEAVFNAFQNFQQNKEALKIDGIDAATITKIDKFELHVMIPQANAYKKDQNGNLPTATDLSDNLYSNMQGVLKGTIIPRKGRKISFACKCKGSTLQIIDIPTTIQASYQTAQAILGIDDGAFAGIDGNRYITKEINMFKATLNKLLEGTNLSSGVIIEEISCNEITGNLEAPATL